MERFSKQWARGWACIFRDVGWTACQLDDALFPPQRRNWPCRLIVQRNPVAHYRRLPRQLKACPGVRQRPGAAATAPPTVTPAWPPSTRCSATPCCATPRRRGHRPGAGHPAQAQRPQPDHLPHRGRDHRAPVRASWTGRRDHAPLMLACQTDLRATELIILTIGDIHLGVGALIAALVKARQRPQTRRNAQNPNRAVQPLHISPG